MRFLTFFRSACLIAVSFCLSNLAFANPSMPAVVPAGNIVYMHEFDNVKQIVLADANGQNPRILSEEGVWALYPEISSDGRYVSYSRGANETALGIVIRDLSTGDVEEWTPANGQYLHSSFSGDGRYLAFSGPIGEGGAQRIGVIDLRTQRPLMKQALRDGTPFTPEVRIIPAVDPSYFPALSSAGTFLVYQRSTAQMKSIVKLDLETGEETQITAADGYAMAPALSREDRFVAYTAKVNNVWDLYKRDLWSNEVKQMTKTPYLDYAPSFRPDGGIVFAGNPNGNFELYEIDADAVPQADGTYIAQILVSGNGDHYAPSVTGSTQYVMSQALSFPNPERSSFGAIAHNGKVYMVGGHQGPEHTYPPESFMDRLEIYDPTTQTWTQGASLSLARHGFSLAAYGNFVYAFGGFTYSADHSPKWKSVDLIERYDVTNNRWEVVGHLPRNRSSNVVAQVGTKVYLIGGWDSTPPAVGSAEGQFHEEIDMFDLETEQVSTLEVKLPAPKRRALSAVVKGDEVILIGGLGQGASHFDLLDQVTAFNTKASTFRELAKLPFPTFAPAAGIIGNELYVFGGMFKTGPMDFIYVNHVYAHILGSNSWNHTGRHLTETKGFAQVVDIAPNTLGILGGHTYVGDQDHPVSTFEIFGQH